MARRKRRRTSREDEVDLQDAVAEGTAPYVAASSGSLIPELSRSIGINNVSNSFHVGDDNASPKMLFRDVVVEIFNRLDYTGDPEPTDVTFYVDDPVGKTIIQEFFPVLEDYLLRTSGTTYAPTRAAIAAYFADVEYAYQLAKTIRSMKSEYDFNYSMIPPHNVDVPSSIWAMGSALDLDDTNFELTWSPLFRRLGQHVLLPSVKNLIDRVYMPFTMGPTDTVLRAFVLQASLLTNFVSVLESYKSDLKAILDELDTPYFKVVTDWLTKFLNWRVGIVTTAISLSDGELAQTWWNGSTVLFDVQRDIASASSSPPTSFWTTRAMHMLLSGGTIVANPPVDHATSTDPFCSVHAVGGQLTMEELALMPIYGEIRYDTSNWRATLLTAVSTGAIYWINENTLVGSAPAPLPVNTAGLTATQLITLEYIGTLAYRYCLSPGSTTDAAYADYAPLDGTRTPSMPPTKQFADQLVQLSGLWTVQHTDLMLVRALEVGSGASLPRSMNQKIAEIQANWLP